MIVDDLNLAGFFAELVDGRLVVEGLSNKDVSWVIEEDFDVFFLYEYEDDKFIIVDSYAKLDDALKAAEEL